MEEMQARQERLESALDEMKVMMSQLVGQLSGVIPQSSAGQAQETAPTEALPVPEKETRHVSEQVAKFLRANQSIKPLRSKPSERQLMEWLDALDMSMSMVQLRDNDRKQVVAALVFEETCRRWLLRSCEQHDAYDRAMEAWVTALYPTSWYHLELFQMWGASKTYRTINEVVAEVTKAQRRWNDAMKRRNFKFDVGVFFWKMILLNKIPQRFHEKIQDLVNAEQQTFEEFTVLITNKLEILDVGDTVLSPIKEPEFAEDCEMEVAAIKRGAPDGARESDERITKRVEHHDTRVEDVNHPLAPRRHSDSLPDRRSPAMFGRPGWKSGTRAPQVRTAERRWKAFTSTPCHRCGKSGHKPDDCYVLRLGYNCYHCGKPSHIAAVCRKKQSGVHIGIERSKTDPIEHLEAQIAELQRKVAQAREKNQRAAHDRAKERRGSS